MPLTRWLNEYGNSEVHTTIVLRQLHHHLTAVFHHNTPTVIDLRIGDKSDQLKLGFETRHRREQPHG